jgi:uncharacterized membrane protein
LRLTVPGEAGDQALIEMKRKFNLRKTIVLAIAFVLCGSAVSANAFAVGASKARGTNVHHADGIFQRADSGYGWHRWDRPSSERDLWGHWGSYYGPMI